jgi:hypothetical protein
MALRATPLDHPGVHVLDVPKPRRRPLLWVFALLVLGAGSALAWYIWKRSQGPVHPLLAFVPGDAQAVVVVDWKRLTANRGFGALLRQIAKRFFIAPEAKRLYHGLKLDHAQVESAALAVKGLLEGRRTLVLARGSFDAPAVVAALRGLGWEPATDQGAALLRSADGKVLGGFVEPTLLAVGGAPLVEDVVRLAAGKGESLAAEPRHGKTLARIDPRALAFGAIELPEALRRDLAAHIPEVPIPKRAAVSIDDRAFAVEIRAALGYAEERDAAQVAQILPGLLRERARGLEGRRKVPFALVQLASAFSAEAEIAAKDEILVAKTQALIEGEGLLGTIRGVILPMYLASVRRPLADAELGNLQRIAEAAVASWEKRRRFPPTAGPSPKLSSCDVPGWRFPPDPGAWEDATWKALGFSLAAPHVLQYTFQSSGKGRRSRFAVQAIADFGCNGVWTVFEISGRVGKDRKVELTPLVEK